MSCAGRAVDTDEGLQNKWNEVESAWVAVRDASGLTVSGSSESVAPQPTASCSFGERQERLIRREPGARRDLAHRDTSSQKTGIFWKSQLICLASKAHFIRRGVISWSALSRR
jgi:hypothetical protein